MNKSDKEILNNFKQKKKEEVKKTLQRHTIFMYFFDSHYRGANIYSIRY
jgi:hypothetical protein